MLAPRPPPPGVLSRSLLRRAYFLAPATASAPAGLEDGAGVLEHVLDRGADGVVVDHDHLVHILLAQAEGFGADLLDGGAVGEDADCSSAMRLPAASDGSWRRRRPPRRR